ncbi:hypothetical protein PHSC3_001375 [Chlamydiales bacterium STE3]|nr:hypothetical protein PHSC3_001375 [Chlamydiales bacterium STE3]
MTAVLNRGSISEAFQNSHIKIDPSNSKGLQSGYAYIVGISSNKHPVTREKFKAICFSLLERNHLESNHRELKKMISCHQFAIVTLKDGRFHELQMHIDWQKKLSAEKVTEIVFIDENKDHILIPDVVRCYPFNSENYKTMEDFHKITYRIK